LGKGLASTNDSRHSQLTADLEQVREANTRLVSTANAAQLKYDQLCRESEHLNDVAKDIEKERDFYFNKVLQVENLCKACPDQNMSLLENIYSILYQTEEEESVAADNSTNAKNTNNTNNNGNNIINDVTPATANSNINNSGNNNSNNNSSNSTVNTSQMNMNMNVNANVNANANVNVEQQQQQQQQQLQPSTNMSSVQGTQNPFPSKFDIGNQMSNMGIHNQFSTNFAANPGTNSDPNMNMNMNLNGNNSNSNQNVSQFGMQGGILDGQRNSIHDQSSIQRISSEL
jgi:hypothetical protein